VAQRATAGELTPAATGAGGWVFPGPAEDADARALLRASVMPGSVEVAFTREPSLAAGSGLAGTVDRILVHREGSTVDAIGRLGVQECWRGGGTHRIGYFGDLRIGRESHRPARLLRDGFRILCEVAEELGVEGCFTSIAIENQRARRVLERGRRIGLPEYLPIADLVTLLVPVRNRRSDRGGPVQRRGATESELTTFLDGAARGHDLALVWHPGRWPALARHGLSPGDFHVLRREGRVAAGAALWDQRAFRQTVIRGYRGTLRWSRPVVNAVASAGLAPPLPRPGSVLSQVFVVGAAAEPGLWAELLGGLVAEAARRGVDWLVLSRDSRDPELPVLRRFRGVREYHTRLYEVRWGELPTWTEEWGQRLVRPEAGLL
jgi:hypothetical protein